MSRILILAEHNGKKLAPSFPKLMGAAHKLGGEAVVVVAGSGIAAVAVEAATYAGVSRVVQLDDAALARPTAEVLSANLAPLAEGCSHIMAATGTYSRGPLARLAARLNAVMLSDVAAISSPTSFTRPVYAGAVMANVDVQAGAVIVMTVRFSAFEAAAAGNSAAVETAPVIASPVVNQSTGVDMVQSDRPELTSARLVVSGGRALGSKENFALIETLADTLGAAVGASRAAVDAGYAPNDWQVGQTGKVVAPDVYIAVGISGAVQHLAGIKSAKTIVAINKDPNAPIFQVADYGLVADLFEVIPQLTAQLKAGKAA